MQRKGNPLAVLVWECKLEQPLWKTIWRVLKKLQIELPYDPAIAQYYLSKGYKNADLKGHMHPNVYGRTIDNSQIMGRAQMSIYWWMDKDDVNEWKNEILPFATTRIETECFYAKWNQSEMLSEISQKKRYMISLICGI